MSEPVIVIHGGAWAIPEELWEESINGVKKGAVIGFKVLLEGGSAIDAVEKSIVELEDNPVFDAGKGSVLTSDYQVEMDALIMDGRSLNTGAVAAIKNIANPIKVARMVMEKTQHNLIVGEGANAFAELQGVDKVDPESLVGPQAKKDLELLLKFKNTIDTQFNHQEKHDTVGCVSLDKYGNLACGTSTGGITAKMPGRVGDSPIVGAGGMADNEIGAVSTTGHGEAISKVALAKTVLTAMKNGFAPSAAIVDSLSYMERRVNGYGGAIVVSKDGEVGTQFTTERMAWAYIKNYRLYFGLHPGQHCEETLVL